MVLVLRVTNVITRFRFKVEMPKRQFVTKIGLSSLDLKPVTQRTTDSEFCGVGHGRHSSLTFYSPRFTLDGSRSKSVMDTVPNGNTVIQRVPVLGPTRQQTEFYLKRRANQKMEKLGSTVLHVDGSSKHPNVGQRMIIGEIAVNDDKTANTVLVEAEGQLKSGYPTIAASSMITRMSQIAIADGVEPKIDMKFLSEFVKPVPHRWKLQKSSLKTISPSKDGFHQRSNSPTFQRLVMATEKLRKYVHDEEVNNGEQRLEENFLESQGNEWPTFAEKHSVEHSIKYDVSARTSQTCSVMNPTSLILQEKNTELLKKEHQYFYSCERDEHYASKFASSEQLTPTSPPVVAKKVQQEFKVDFKKLESHSELHLFLPHIHESSSRAETPESPHRNSKITFMLPHIEGSVDAKSPEEEKSKSKRRQKNETRKKKKNKTRVKSGKVEKVVKDPLNEVPTLISLGNDMDFHPASMCMFENCAKHMHAKSIGIRQS